MTNILKVLISYFDTVFGYELFGGGGGGGGGPKKCHQFGNDSISVQINKEIGKDKGNRIQKCNP